MELDERLEVREEASDILTFLINSTREGLAYMHAMIDGSDFDYASLEEHKLDRRKYSLENSLNGILFTLRDYLDECDVLSFGGETKAGRKYFIRPYLEGNLFYFLEGLVYDVSDTYGIDIDDAYKLKIHGPKKNEKSEKIKKVLEEIIELKDSNRFVFDVRESVKSAEGVHLEVCNKI